MKLRPILALMALSSLLTGFARGEPLKVGDAAPAVTASLTVNGRQIAADGLNLPGGSYGQLAGVVSGFWSWLSGGASREAKIAEAANCLMDNYRQSTGSVDIQGEVTKLGTIQGALASSRQINHALDDFLNVLDQVAA